MKCDSGQKSPEPILQTRFLEDGHREQYNNSVQVQNYETKKPVICNIIPPNRYNVSCRFCIVKVNCTDHSICGSCQLHKYTLYINLNSKHVQGDQQSSWSKLFPHVPPVDFNHIQQQKTPNYGVLAMAFDTLTVRRNERDHFTVYNTPHYWYFGNLCHQTFQ